MDKTLSDRTLKGRAFYFKLGRDIMVDLREDGSEILEDALHRGVVSLLGLWETRFLDEDGGTTVIQRLLKENKNIFSVWSNGFGVATNSCVAAFEKYGHLAAPELHATIANIFQQEESSNAFLESWEARFLDADGGTTLIQRLLKENEDIFNNWSTASGKAENSCSEAMQKYAHLATPEFFTTIATEFERRKKQLIKFEAETSPISTASLDATSRSQGADNSTLSTTITRSHSPTMLTAVHGGGKRALGLRLLLGLLWLGRWSLLLLLWWCWCTLLRQWG